MNNHKLQIRGKYCLLPPLTVCIPQCTSYMEACGKGLHVILTAEYTVTRMDICKIYTKEGFPVCKILSLIITAKKGHSFGVHVIYIFTWPKEIQKRVGKMDHQPKHLT